MENEQLVARIKAGMDTGENMLALYEQMKGLIYTMAKRYSGMAEMDDLTQEGYIALYNAVNRYEPSEGVKFSSFAYAVMGRHMVQYIRGDQLIRVPEVTQAKIYKYKQLRNAFYVKSGREPMDCEVKHELQISDKELSNLKKAAGAGSVASLDSVITDTSENFTLADTIPSDEDIEQDITESVYLEQLNNIIWESVDELPDKQPEIIRKRYMENLSLRKTGECLKITGQKVRQEEFKGIKTLRRKFLSILPERMGSTMYSGNGVGTFNNTWTSSTERCALELLGE